METEPQVKESEQPHNCREHAKDIGTCAEGCCDKYKCEICGHVWTEEVPD
jgi:hypothetical protein